MRALIALLSIVLLSWTMPESVTWARQTDRKENRSRKNESRKKTRKSRKRRHSKKRRKKLSRNAIRRRKYRRYYDRYMDLVRKSRVPGRKAVYASWLGGGWVLRHNWKLWMKPASCVKVLTTSTALREMGVDFRFTTQWFGTVGDDGIMKTPLYWWSDGDPTITDDDVRDMVRKLKALGVRQIPRGVVIDDHYFDRRIPPGFEKWRGYEGYRARPSAVMVNRNRVAVALWEEGGRLRWLCYPESPFIECHIAVQPDTRNKYKVKAKIRHGILKVYVKGRVLVPNTGKKKWISVRALDPARLAAGTLIHELRAAGIQVPPAYRRGHVDRNLPVLVLRKSKPLLDVVRQTNQASINVYAENILKALGAYKSGPPGTTRKGLVPVKDLIARAGFSKRKYSLHNGSGLFGNNRIPPIVLVGVLKRLHTLPWLYKALYDSLAVPRHEGTMFSRFKDFPKAERYLHAKTGTLGDATCLTGYLTRGNKTLVFAIMHDNIKGRIKGSRKLEDDVVKLLVDILENEAIY